MRPPRRCPAPAATVPADSQAAFGKAARYDARGKKQLKFNEKFYLADHSLLKVFNDDLRPFKGAILENIVYNELLYRGYEVRVGVVGDLEIDFIASKQEQQLYIQVAYLMEDDATFERELAPLQKINTAHPRLILSYSKARLGNYDGIQNLYLPDWLLRERG
jgi:predicted AAA+ superfamily ATPase